MWERGLKYLISPVIVYTQVAPHVGAWIEIQMGALSSLEQVAPHVGA